MNDISRSPGLRAAIRRCQTPLQAIRMHKATTRSLRADQAKSEAWQHRANCWLLVEQARKQLAGLIGKKTPPGPTATAADIGAARRQLSQRVAVLAKADQQLAEATRASTHARAVMCRCWSLVEGQR